MALPLLAGLNVAARAALPIIQAGVKEKLSSRAINSIIKDSFGKGIRRSTLLDIMRAETNVERAGAALKYILPRNRPSINRLPTAITRIRRKYSFVVKVVGAILDTGETMAQNITVSTDTLLTRGELERLAEEAINNAQQRYGFTVESSLLIRGVRAGEEGTLSSPGP